MSDHEERAHSKYSASGSLRWLSCAASVELEEKSPPSKDSWWAKEGTFAHEIHEARLLGLPLPENFLLTKELLRFVDMSVNKIKATHEAAGGTLLVEKRVYNTFIHEEMFGTCDAIIAGNDRTLYIDDFKYGQGHIVEAKDNTQLIQYALGVAESYDWDRHFNLVKMRILQPRAGKDWYKTWVITMNELKNKWLPLWEKGVARVVRGGNKPMPGAWCHYCRAKLTCPAKQATRVNAMTDLFETNPLTNGDDDNGFEEKGGEKTRQEIFKEKYNEARKLFPKGEAEAGEEIEAEESFF